MNIAVLITCRLPYLSAKGKITRKIPKEIMYALITTPARVGSTPGRPAIAGNRGETTQLSTMTTKPARPSISGTKRFEML